MAERSELLQGTLDTLVLRTLLLGPLHGYGIAKSIKQVSNESLQIGVWLPLPRLAPP